jgi:hypothetical protein
MISNVGALDRLLRIALGLAMLCLAFFGPKSSLGWLGAMPLMTGIFGSCPLYESMRWSTVSAAAK